MKKNFLIMMIMLLCTGFAFAQINTVRGFVPGAGTGAQGNNHQTYAVFGQMFGDIDLNADHDYEVAEGLAQAQLIADTVEAVVGCGDSLKIGAFTLSAAAIETIVNEFAADPTRPRDTFLTIQHPNAAQYNYDQLLVLHLFVCPCTIDDYNGNPYDVVAIDNICWTKTNMRATTTCGGTEVVTKSYSTDVTPELDPATFGLLYTWENASKDSKCDSNYVTGICPCGWHLPTAAEVDTILKSYTNDLRSNGGYWVVPEGITNLTKFTAEPAGYFDSLATRFEGFHSEADFWYVATDSTCDANYFQIYYFCDKPKHEPRNVNTDAMSVRCVLDMIYDYHKDDPTPNPDPNPNPNSDCPEITSVLINSDYLVMGTIANYQANDVVTYTAKVNFTDGSYQNYTNQQVTSIEDGNFTIEIPLYSVANADAVFSDFYGEVFVTRANTDCADTAEFDSDANGCPSMDTGGERFVDGVFSMSIWDYDPNYFEDVQVSFTYITEAGEQDPVSVVPSIDDGDESNEVILSATSPFTSITPEMQKVMVYVNFVFKDEYSSCAADLDFPNFSWECYPRCEDQHPAQVTSAGVSVVASNKISFELENYTDADVLRFDGTVYVTDGGVQQAIPVQSPTTGIYVLHTPNTNVWGYEYTPTSSTATVDSMKGYVRLNPDDICGTSAPFNTSSYNAVTPQEPTTGYTCPESLGSITQPSSNNVGYDYYCTINGDASYIQEVTVTYLYYVPGNTSPAFSLPASNVVKQQYGEIQFNNPTAQQLQGHSLDDVYSIMIQVHATLDQSCGTNFIDQTLTFPVQH